MLVSSRGPFLSALSSRSRATESRPCSVLYGTLQGVAVLVHSSPAYCSCVPSSELLLVSCFSSVGEHCYVFHIKLKIKVLHLKITNNSTSGQPAFLLVPTWHLDRQPDFIWWTRGVFVATWHICGHTTCLLTEYHRISQNSRGWKGPLWVI